jgi:PAS domain S-box-containing protein
MGWTLSFLIVNMNMIIFPMKAFISCAFQPINEMMYGLVAWSFGAVSLALREGCRGTVRSISAVLGLGLLLLSGHAAQEASAEIRSFAQLKSLSTNQAMSGLRVEIPALVLCYDPGWGQLHFHDGQEPFFLSPLKVSQSLEISQYVQINATTCLEAGLPGLTNVAVTVIGSRELPPAKPVEVKDLPKLPSAWVELTGVVRATEASRSRLGMVIRDGEYPCTVYVVGGPAQTNHRSFEGCKVSMRVLNMGVSKRGSREMPMVFAPSISTVKVIEQPSKSHSTAPVITMEALLDQEFGEWTNNVVHLSGVVSAYEPGQFVIVREPVGLLRANVIQVDPIQPGTRVDLWGYLAVTQEGPILDDACFEEVRFVNTPAPAPVPQQEFTQRPTLTNLAGVYKLSRAEQAQHIPVRARGCITFADPVFQVHFVQDRTDAIFFSTTQTNLKAGQYVEILAQTDPGGFNPQLINAEATVLGVTNLPRAIGVELDDLAQGHLDCHWIELDGIVRRAEVENDHLQLVVTTSRGKFRAVVPGITAELTPTNLVDSAVRLSGACASLLNPAGQLIGIELKVPDLDHAKIVVPAAQDVFATASVPIGTVAKYDPKRLVGHRLKIAGTVTFCVGGESVYVQDETGAIRVKTQQNVDLAVGDKVEVLGFPALGELLPQLEEPVFRKVGSGGSVTPQKTTAYAILRDGRLDGTFVELEAQLVQTVRASARPRLVLRQGATIFTAQLSSQTSGARLVGLESGCVLLLKGVCSVQASDNRQPEAFRLLLANAQDVQVLKRPSWLTPGRLVAVTSLLALVIVGTLGWVTSLRRQVSAQTEVIRQKLQERQLFAEKLAQEKQLLSTLIDHLPDHVFARDVSRRYLLANRRYTQFYGLPTHEWLVGKTPDGLLKGGAAASSLEFDEHILRNGVKLLQGEAEVEDAFGRLRWLHTTRVPLEDEDGKVIGLVGISRDVTEQKRAEEEMEKLHQRLLETSRQAGMAEVATSVLHNVGNVLNSVNISAGVIAEQIRESRVLKVAEIAALLEHNKRNLGHFITEDVKGRHLPGYLKLLGEHLKQGQSLLVHELEGLMHNVEHIKEIVAMQQSYARVRGVLEKVAIADLVEDALRMNAGAIARHHLQVKRAYDPSALPQITVEKHKVLQILVNLIRNAKYACDESGREDKVLTVSVSNGDNQVKVSIEDNGVGIAPENLTKIFNHGFTTRASGHGFGLHSGALAAKEMSGALIAHSDGLGKGARFTLELPINPPSV